MELFHNPDVYMTFIPVALLAILIEGLGYYHRNGTFPWRDNGVTLVIFAGHALAGVVTKAMVTTGLGIVVWRYRLTTIEMTPVTVVVLFVMMEFAYYWYHRSAHRMRLMWGSHSVHHSPEVITLTAAMRLPWTPILSLSWLFYIPMVWIGFPPEWVFGIASAGLLYQFWLHTTLVPPLGWLEGIINTPSAHRVHHASNDLYLDRNYGGVLMIFDRIFGTYTPERSDIPLRYGLVHPATSHNPIIITFDEFRGMVRDLRIARSWRERFGYLLCPPGWKPNNPNAR